jgi:hypothetical protein
MAEESASQKKSSRQLSAVGRQPEDFLLGDNKRLAALEYREAFIECGDCIHLADSRWPIADSFSWKDPP